MLLMNQIQTSAVFSVVEIHMAPFYVSIWKIDIVMKFTSKYLIMISETPFIRLTCDQSVNLSLSVVVQ